MGTKHWEKELEEIRRKIRELREKEDEIERRIRSGKGYLIAFKGWSNLNGYYVNGDPLSMAGEICQRYGTEAYIYDVEEPRVVGIISAEGEFCELS